MLARNHAAPWVAGEHLTIADLKLGTFLAWYVSHSRDECRWWGSYLIEPRRLCHTYRFSSGFIGIPATVFVRVSSREIGSNRWLTWDTTHASDHTGAVLARGCVAPSLCGASQGAGVGRCPQAIALGPTTLCVCVWFSPSIRTLAPHFLSIKQFTVLQSIYGTRASMRGIDACVN